MNGRKIMTRGYMIASGAAVFFLCFVIAASYYGWGLRSDAQAVAEAQRRSGGGGGSVRTGSLHTRRYYSGGSGK